MHEQWSKDPSYKLAYEELFGDLEDALFTTSESIEYLEVSASTFRRYIKDGKLIASNKIGGSCFYSLDNLRELKFKSGICESIHSTASGLYRAGLLGEKTMHEFDKSCLSKPKGRKNKKPL